MLIEPAALPACRRYPALHVGRLCGLSRGEQPPNVIVNDLCVIRLWYRAFLTELLCGLNCTRQCARKDHIETGSMFAHPLGQTEAVESTRHFDVGEHKVDDGLFVG